MSAVATEQDLIVRAMAGHIAYLAELLEVVCRGFSRAIDHLDDTAATEIMAIMGEHGVRDLLAREMVA